MRCRTSISARMTRLFGSMPGMVSQALSGCCARLSIAFWGITTCCGCSTGQG